MRRLKRILSIILAAVMIFSMLPALIAAAAWPSTSWQDSGVPDTAWYSTQTTAGQGTQANPYVISSSEQLAGLASLVNNGTSFQNKYISLDADIDLGGRSWGEIGTNDHRFTGNFDGNGHVIRNLTHYASTWEEFGLFGWIDTNSTSFGIKNLGLVDVNIDGLITEGGSIAAFVGIDGYFNNSVVQNCFATGYIHSNANTGMLGGLIGEIDIINTNGSSMTIKNCYSACDISLTSSNNETWYTRYAGGLMGQVQNFGGSSLTISNSYSASRVTAANLDRSRIGAFTGYIGNSSQISMTNCMFDTQAAGIGYGFDKTSAAFAGVHGETTLQMSGTSALPAGWDTSVWQAQANSYPQLKLFNTTPGSVAGESSLVSTIPIFLFENNIIPALSDTVVGIKHNFTVPVVSGVSWNTAPAGILAIDNTTGQVTFTSPTSDTTVKVTAQLASGVQKDFVVLCKSGVDPSDTTPPSITIGTITPADFSANVSVTSNETADIYVLIKAAADPAPANAGELVADSKTVKGNDIAFNAAISGLNCSTIYVAYVIGIDPTGNVSGISSQTFTTLQDQTPPSWTGNSMVTISGKTASFEVAFNEAGTLKYVALPSSLTQPSKDQVAAGQDASGAAAYYSAQNPYSSANSWPNISTDFSTFAAGAYNIFIIDEDAYGNKSNIVMLSFSVPSSANSITSFSVPAQVGDSIIDSTAHTVTFHMITGTAIIALVPIISLSDNASITPASGVSQDFTGPVSYTVTAEDGTPQIWTVTCIADIPAPTSEALTVSSPATTGFTVALNPSLAGLTASNFTLLDSSSQPVTITGATTTDSGATYAISAVLSEGQTYTVTATEVGYTFGTAQSVVVPAAQTTNYTVSIGGLTGGSITASPTSAPSGTGINLTITPSAGMRLKAGTLKYNDGTTDHTIIGTSFTMPAANVIVSAVFEGIPNTTHGGGGGSTSGGETTVTGSVINGNGTQVSNVTAKVTSDTNGNYTVSMNAAQVVTLQQPNGTMSPLSDLSKVTFISVVGSSETVSSDGIINLQNLAKGTDNNFNITYNLGNGQTITIGTMEITVSSSGAVSLTCILIDPYGIIIDAATGKPIAGANVTLYYANTDRNKTNGKTPDTVAALPGINGFKPNNNQDPQASDASGAYGFMVFPTTDYYIVATKDGYNNYMSPTISVEQDIVKWDIKMNPTTSGVTRLAGLNRVDTSLAIAKANYTGKLSNVILARADNYPDALAGSVLAYKLNAPILLVGSSDADQEKVLAYMKDTMDPAGTVYILGGTAVVSNAMESKVTASGFANITRLGGTDRYETSVKIADQLKVKSGTPIVLVYGENYPDALSISSIAAEMRYPILLVQKDGLNDAVKNEITTIKPTKVYIIGGEGVIGATVENQVAQITSQDKAKIVRIAGVDRYETSLAVAKYFDLSGQSVCIATGNNFPDALAGSVYASNHNAPIILADGSLSDQVKDYLKNKKLTGATLFGGEAVVSKTIEQQLGKLMGK